MVAMASSTPLQSPPVKGPGGFSDYRQWSGRSGLGGLVIIGNGQAGVGKGV